MKNPLSDFAAQVREFIQRSCKPDGAHGSCSDCQAPSGDPSEQFEALALELFALQFEANPAYRAFCRARRVTPHSVSRWTQIPAVPTGAFKELDLTALTPRERVAVFHSSGTTGQRPSRHFHSAESLALYEASLWPWFRRNALADQRSGFEAIEWVCLTPGPAQAPRSSLVHMFECLRRNLQAPQTAFLGRMAPGGEWRLDLEGAVAMLGPGAGPSKPKLILGTAFSFVHLLDFLAEQRLRFELPPGSLVMETGGYKNRSRAMPKTELHALISHSLGVPAEKILCEYGMSELSSQAYAGPIARAPFFQFPPWARAQILSPETGREVAEGETGLVRVLDLANVFSVAAIQTEDLAVRRAGGFELLGRLESAEPRGCSLQSAPASLHPALA